jgi:gamma-glutamyltranspeptidase/glutathione hydrolase
MLTAVQAGRGMVTAPHHLAAEVGLSVLREGGNAIEAMVASAATIAVVYPHMTGIGGDGFWLIAAPGAEPVGIDACGASGRRVEPALYRGRQAVPPRGPLAANTAAGTVSGWHEALALSAEWGGRLPLARLLEDAVHYAEDGFPAPRGLAHELATRRAELGGAPGFADTFYPHGAAPAAGSAFRNSRLAATLRALAAEGLDSFYRGSLAGRIAADLAAAGSLVGVDDLAAHAAKRVRPLSVPLRVGTAYNLPPPTQGLASLMILALFDRLGVAEADGFAHIHGLVEATKQAFLVRDRVVADPAIMTDDPVHYLAAADLDARAARIDPSRALAWPRPADAGGTIWMGAVDAAGRAVSFIQSLYWEFGSGVVLGDTGIVWQNRGASFGLAAGAKNALAPRRKPFHTLNPALARLGDGRVLVYGTMGGDGQPQTQAAVFTRYAGYGQDLQAAVSAPRWLLGRTWGDASTALKLESRIDPRVVAALAAAGHAVETVEPWSQLMGHAGALVRHAGGLIEGASDPRSDGRAAGY